MTRKEAIKILGRLLLHCNPTDCPHNDCGKCVEAINMAEDALEQELNHEKDIEHENYIENKEVSFKITIPAHDIKIEG